jgi:predicted O-linked N-acetylglucosamine transferase (SPINDLY family)
MMTLARAVELLKAGKIQECVDVTGDLLRRNPRDPGALRMRGLALARLGRIGEAFDAHRRALALNPRDAQIRAEIAQYISILGRPGDAVDALRESLRLNPDNVQNHSGLLYVIMFDPRCDGQAVYEERKRWGDATMARLARPSSYPNDRNPNRRLRVGYVSAHFRNHAVNVFLEPILTAHDKSAVEVFCYSSSGEGDAVTQRLRTIANQFRDITALSNDDAASAIFADQIDILVDIDGHMGRTRVEIFARKPAPVQVSYIGDQATTGLSCIDWRLTDAVADPPGAERLYTEKLYRMPEAFFTYLGWPDVPPVNPPPSSTGDAIIFGSFNHSSKLSDDAIVTWAKLLQRVPTARLGILVHDVPIESARMNALFARNGIAHGRVVYLPRVQQRQYLSVIERTDIALDSLPFSGHTTTCDCLSMGVPVVTLAGETYSRRMSASVLHYTGNDDLVAQTPEQYVDIAASLAEDVQRLTRLRMELRQRMKAVTNSGSFTAQLESSYRRMWHTYLNLA